MNHQHWLTPMAPLAVTVAATTGCTSMSGLNGGSGYSCKAPEGVACDSMSGVYANSLADRLPARRAVPASSGPPSPAPVAATPVMTAPATAVAAPPTTASSLRSPARVLRLWVKPWEDADGDLIDQSYVYVQVDSGQWLIEHAQRQIREAYVAVKPPPRLLKSEAPPDAGQGPQRPPVAILPRSGVPRPPNAFDAED